MFLLVNFKERKQDSRERLFPFSKHFVDMHFCLYSSRFVIILHNIIPLVVCFQLLAEFALIGNFRL